MKISHLVIICVTLLIGVSVWCVTDHERGTSTETKTKVNVAAIESVLEADSRLASVKPKSFSDYVEKMDRIDLSSCPTDFQQAYLAHIGAWDEVVMAENARRRYNDRYNSASFYLECFLRGMRFDMSPGTECDRENKRIVAMLDKAEQDIQSTFLPVQQLAVGYGAKLPPAK